MRTVQLLRRNLSYYWRTNLAVMIGVAIAVAVLAGALLVGDSVRGSLRDLVVQRLGGADRVITSSGFFREQLADDIGRDSRFTANGFIGAVPMISLQGTVTHEANRRVSSDVLVYGVDERFWAFHERQKQAPGEREVLVSEGLARELESKNGDFLLLHVQKPTDIPAESLHSKKDDLARTLRLTLRETLPAAALGDFSIQPQQGVARAVFVPLKLLQKEIEQQGKANLILIDEANDENPNAAGVLSGILKDAGLLEDYGITLRELSNQQSISVEHESRLLSDVLWEAANIEGKNLGLRSIPVFSYLANNISANANAVPYSLVTALDDQTFDELGRLDGQILVGEKSAADFPSPIILNDWAARDLGVSRGAGVTLEYYLWGEDGRLETKTASFYLKAIVPISGLAADRDLVPDYPGITGSENLADWDPPFPVDLDRIRQQDEDYWDQYRTTPKAFISLTVGQKLWSSRFGKLTSLKLAPALGKPLRETLNTYRQRLKASLDPTQMRLVVIPVRQQSLAASRGATDFGEYFLYFSFFLVVSALLLTALFFKLGVEQRLREIGLLQAIGFPAAQVRNLFLLEGVVLCMIGSLLGLLGAIGYGQLMMLGLRTWWIDAVGTTMLKLHIAPVTLIIGALGGVLTAVLCIVWTLRRLRRTTTRSLLMGSMKREAETRGRGDLGARGRGELRSLFTSLRVAAVATVLGFGLVLAAALQLIGQVGGFFGGGTLLLVAALCYQSAWLGNNRGKTIHGSGWSPILRLGFRNATHRPGRSVLCIALIASAAFIIVSVDAFRRTNGATEFDRKSGNGGFPLLAESLVPLVNDPNSQEGREAINLSITDQNSPLNAMTMTRFRLKPGDDASCLNLYQPRNPRIIAPRDEFIVSSRFAFAGSLAETAEEKSNPWNLLQRRFPDGVIPVIADANSMTYVLHLKLGDDFILNRQSGPVRLRMVAALADSILQSELVMSEQNFLSLFPEEQGYRFFLIDTKAPGELATVLEDRLSDYGFDVVSTAERLATFHRVENTYLSTFQMLGGLGLLLGTLGLAAVLLRNVLERRRELALLRAVGYNSAHFTVMVIGENALLLFCGLVTGTACALLAIAPVFFERGGRMPNVSLGLLLLGVLVSGLAASFVATWAALRSPLLPALRAE